MPIYKFNDKLGNRSRGCTWSILHDGKYHMTKEAQEAKLAIFKALSFEKNGKWSNTTWEVHTASAKLIVCMSPFEGWSDDLARCVAHVISSCKSYLGWEPTEEEALGFFQAKYPGVYTKVTAKTAAVADLV